MIDRGLAASADERAQVSDKMVDVLNRRNYIRNLVRDVNEAMEELDVDLGTSGSLNDWQLTLRNC